MNDMEKEQSKKIPFVEFKRKASTVFTPRRTAEEGMYVPRDDVDDAAETGKTIQETVEEAVLGEHYQIILYGDSGVGKTNLLQHAAKAAGIKYRTQNVIANQGIESFMSSVLIALGDEYEEKSQQKTVSASLEASIETSKFSSIIASIRGAITGGFQKSIDFEKLPVEPRDALLRALVAADCQLLIVDNVHNLKDDSDMLFVGESMEYFSDLPAQEPDWPFYPRIAAAGISNTAEFILNNNLSIERRVKQVRVPHMSEDKIRRILETGFDKLGLTWDAPALELAVFYSDGYPYFAHALGLECSGNPRVYAGMRVESDHVQGAALSVAGRSGDSTRSIISRARGKQSKIRVRSKVLDIIANEDWPEWTSRKVSDKWETYFDGAKIDQGSVTNALNQLADEDKDMQLLRRTGNSTEFRYRFKNPHYRPYLRMETSSNRGPVAD